MALRDNLPVEGQRPYGAQMDDFADAVETEIVAGALDAVAPFDARLTEVENEVEQLTEGVIPELTDAGIAAVLGTDGSASQAAVIAQTETAVNALIDGAPGALDTLTELAAALGDDPNFAATITAALANRVRFDAAQSLTAPEQDQARSNIGAASTVQGAKADSAVQPGSLSTVATSGAYTDLSGRPTLGTAASQNSTAFAPASHTHPAAQISDSTATGRSVVTAASQAAARTAIGAGTSSLALGTTGATAKAGDYHPAAANITDATAVGRAVLTAADEAAARAAIGATSGGGGGVDPEDVGYDIVIVAGQSNAAGAGEPDLPDIYDVPHDRVLQYALRGTYVDTITKAVDPLYGAPQDALEDSAQGVGPGVAFARSWAQRAPVNRSMLIVPCAVGSSGLVGGHWVVGGAYYQQVIDATVRALDAAGPNARVAAIIWVQGETDASASVSQAAYATAFDAMVAGWRANIPGAETAKVIVGSMVPEWVAAGGGTRAAIQAAHVETPTRINAIFVQGPTGYAQASGVPNIHYTAAGERELGRRMAAAYYGTTVEAPNRLKTVPGSTSATVSWHAPLSIPAATTYRIDYREVGATTWTAFGSPTSALNRTVTGLTNGTEYDFRVRVEAPTAGPWSAVTRERPSAYAGAVATDAPLVYVRGDTSRVVDLKGLAVVSMGDQTRTGAGIGDGGRSLDLSASVRSRLLLGSPAGLASAAFTVETLVRFDALNADQYLVARDDGGTIRDWRFSVVLEGGVYKVDFYKLDGTIVNARTTSGLAVNTTYHLAATYDGTNIRVYVNGTLSATSAAVTSGTMKQTQQISVGNSSGTYNGGVDGRMAGLALYNKALTTARVLAHAQAAGVA